MNRTQLVASLTDTLGDKKVATSAVDALLEAVQTTVAAGEKVSLFGFGVFEKVDRPARRARNPATGEPIELDESSVPRFRPGAAFKAAVNAGQPTAAAVSPARKAGAGGASATTPEPAAAKEPAPSSKAKKGPAKQAGDKNAGDKNAGDKNSKKGSKKDKKR